MAKTAYGIVVITESKEEYIIVRSSDLSKLSKLYAKLLSAIELTSMYPNASCDCILKKLTKQNKESFTFEYSFYGVFASTEARAVDEVMGVHSRNFPMKFQ